MKLFGVVNICGTAFLERESGKHVTRRLPRFVRGRPAGEHQEEHDQPSPKDQFGSPAQDYLVIPLEYDCLTRRSTGCPLRTGTVSRLRA